MTMAPGDCKMVENRREQQMVYTKASLGHRVKGEAAAMHGPPTTAEPSVDTYVRPFLACR
jgi:hypothetical protein